MLSIPVCIFAIRGRHGEDSLTTSSAGRLGQLVKDFQEQLVHGQFLSASRDGSCTDDESAEWLNMLLGVKGLWPHIDSMVQGIISDQLVPQIQDAIPDEGYFPGVNIEKLLNFHFTESSLGSQPFLFSNLTMCPGSEGGVKLVTTLKYKSDLDFAVSTSLLDFGLHDFSIVGNLVITFGEFIDKSPLVGGVTLHFVDPPIIDWDMSGVGDVIEKFGWVDSKIRGAVNSAIGAMAVAPNRITTPLAAGVNLASLRNPKPLGLLQVAPGRVENLKKSDRTFFGQKRAPDPYVVLKVGGQKWKSTYKEQSVNATWTGEGALFTVWDRFQSLNAIVMDYDSFTGDDEIGGGSATVKSALGEDVSVVLKSRKSEAEGTLTMFSQWLCFVPGELSLSVLPSVLRVYVDTVQVAANKGHEVKVVAEINKQKSMTRYVKDVEFSAIGIDAVSQSVIRNMRQNEYSKDDIVNLTGLSADVVEKVFSELEEEADGHFDFGSVLYIPLWPGDVDVDRSGSGRKVVNLQVRAMKGKMLASFDIDISSVPKAATLDNSPEYTALKYKEGTDQHVTLHASFDLIGTSNHNCDSL
jgi:hypothetical protein